jgi:hypothetical protein
MKENIKVLVGKVKEYLICMSVVFLFILSSIYVIPQCTSSNEHGIYRLRIWNKVVFGKVSPNSRGKQYLCYMSKKPYIDITKSIDID